ncbi:MAG: ABC transporter ATP-binding protein [Burkholderiaceae bacterium]
MRTDRPILSVQGLHAGYGRTPILHGIDFHVGHGEIVAIVGRNGVGKSTLMKSLIGLLPSTQGTITFDGADVTRSPANARAVRGIGYIPQGRHVFPRLTVRENLQMGLGIGGPQREKQLELVLRTFPILDGRQDQKAGTMSGGEQQQLAIGRALVGNPDLVLLDEPSEGIQPSIVSQIARDMRELNRELGLSVLFVEQNIDMILSMAQRCYVMDKGRIVAQVAPEQLADDSVVRKYLAV